jgi:hypothetical protein
VRDYGQIRNEVMFSLKDESAHYSGASSHSNPPKVGSLALTIGGFRVAQIAITSARGCALAATLYDVCRRLARVRASRSAIGHGHRTASRWDTAVQGNAYGCNHGPESYGNRAGDLHHDRLVDSGSGSADCSRRGVDRSWISGRSMDGNSIDDSRRDPGNDRAWCVFIRCEAVWKEKNPKLKGLTLQPIPKKSEPLLLRSRDQKTLLLPVVYRPRLLQSDSCGLRLFLLMEPIAHGVRSLL